MRTSMRRDLVKCETMWIFDQLLNEIRKLRAFVLPLPSIEMRLLLVTREPRLKIETEIPFNLLSFNQCKKCRNGRHVFSKL